MAATRFTVAGPKMDPDTLARLRHESDRRVMGPSLILDFAVNSYLDSLPEVDRWGRPLPPAPDV